VFFVWFLAKNQQKRVVFGQERPKNHKNLMVLSINDSKLIKKEQESEWEGVSNSILVTF
jgi:hypothetical protein